MEPVFEPIIQKVRRERLSQCQERSNANTPPLDMEALIRRCVHCKSAAAQIQDYESKRPFASLDSYEAKHLQKILKTIERCPSCGEAGYKVHLSFYCQYRRKHRVDVQILAERGKQQVVSIASLDGEIWKLPYDLAKLSLDRAIFATPKETAPAAKTANLGSITKSSKNQQLELIQKILVDFEEQRDPDPNILGPRKLPAAVLSKANQFADLNDSEVPLVVINSHALEVGSEGLLITSERLHCSEAPDPPIKFDQMNAIELRSSILSSSIFINNQRVLTIRGIPESNAKLIVLTLKKLSSLKSEANRISTTHQKHGGVPKPRAARAGMKRRSPKPAPHKKTEVRHSSGVRTRETLSPASRADLERALSALTKRKIPGDLVHVGSIPSEFVANAKKSYAQMDTDDLPKAFIRSHLGDEAAEALISETAIFSNELQAPRGLRFEEIDSVELSEENGVQFLDINGRAFLSQGLLPNWVLPTIKDVLQQCSASNRTSPAPKPSDDAPRSGAPEISPGSNRQFSPRSRRRLSSTNIPLPASQATKNSRRSLSPTSTPPTQTNLPPPTLSNPPSSSQTNRRPPTRSRNHPSTTTNLRLPRPRPPSTTSLHPNTRNLDSRYVDGEFKASQQRPSRPQRKPHPNSSRHRPSQVTAPPSFSRSTRTDLLRPNSPRSPSRSLAPRGVDLGAIDFDLEIVQQANRAWRLGRLEDALQSIESAITVNPMNAELSFAQASLLSALGERVAALDSLVNAIRFGFANKAKVLQDPFWAKLRNDPDLQTLLRRADQRSRHEEHKQLEQIRLALVYVLAHMGNQLPAEARVTSCPTCGDVRLDPAQADYGFTWTCVEAFQLDAVAPLTMEQLHCPNCHSYSVEIIGTVHGFAMDKSEALHIVHWLDAGQVRCRFIFRSDANGYLSEERTFFTIYNASRVNLSQELDSMSAKLLSPVREVVECAIRDLGIPGNEMVIPTLHESLQQSCQILDPRGRLQDPWIVRECLETFVAIRSSEALDSIFACVSQLLSHEQLDGAVAMATAQALNALGGVEVTTELANYVRENVRNAAPAVIRTFALAILDEAEHHSDQPLAMIAEEILGFVGTD